eukprot:GHVS01050753.1.p1 GENE.GHVS01050753.1~~GHVS01050753.1.p1  ORF type:complete len:115 (-),score=42.51 GHVS01050753.1:569-913(-)
MVEGADLMISSAEAVVTNDNPNEQTVVVDTNNICLPTISPTTNDCLLDPSFFCSSPLAPFYIPPAPEDVICETPGGGDLLSSLVYVQQQQQCHPADTTYTDLPQQQQQPSLHRR